MQGDVTRRSLVWGMGLAGLVAVTEALPGVGGVWPRNAAGPRRAGE